MTDLINSIDDINLDKYLKNMVEKEGSNLFISTGYPISAKFMVD